MKHLFFLLLLSSLLFAFTGLKTEQATAHSYMKFTIRNAGFKVAGKFSDFKAEVLYDKNKPEASRFVGRIKAKSIDTGNSTRDRHLRAEDYFHVDKYPEILFESSSIKASAFSTLQVEGNLTIKGKTKKVTLSVFVSASGGKQVFTSKLKINRLDYGVGSSSWTLADELEADIQFVQ